MPYLERGDEESRGLIADESTQPLARINSLRCAGAERLRILRIGMTMSHLLRPQLGEQQLMVGNSLIGRLVNVAWWRAQGANPERNSPWDSP